MQRSLSIETGAGICHTYFDEYGDTAKGAAIINNAKTRRVSVCNALDCVLIHEKRLNDLPEICKKLQDSNVIIFADPQAYHSLEGHYPPALLKPATPESFGTEFLDYKMAIKTVKSIEDALGHIAEYSSKHSESIITENKECACPIQQNCRCRLCIYQCIHGLYRRSTIRIGSRNRYQYAKIACSRSDGTRRNNLLQMDH